MNRASVIPAAMLMSVSFAAAEPPASIPLCRRGCLEGKSSKEVVVINEAGEHRVSGIHNPSITPYLPAKDKATGTAILVIPGGGHRLLAIAHEGRRRGMAGRARHRGVRAEAQAGARRRVDLQDRGRILRRCARAMRLIRSRAVEWNIDPSRVGAIGFSAGESS